MFGKKSEVTLIGWLIIGGIILSAIGGLEPYTVSDLPPGSEFYDTSSMFPGNSYECGTRGEDYCTASCVGDQPLCNQGSCRFGVPVYESGETINPCSQNRWTCICLWNAPTTTTTTTTITTTTTQSNGISCSPCTTDSCQCSISGCDSTGILRIWVGSECDGIWNYENQITNSQVTWYPMTGGTYYAKVFDGSGWCTSCIPITVSGEDPTQCSDIPGTLGSCNPLVDGTGKKCNDEGYVIQCFNYDGLNCWKSHGQCGQDLACVNGKCVSTADCYFQTSWIPDWVPYVGSQRVDIIDMCEEEQPCLKGLDWTDILHPSTIPSGIIETLKNLIRGVVGFANPCKTCVENYVRCKTIEACADKSDISFEICKLQVQLEGIRVNKGDMFYYGIIIGIPLMAFLIFSRRGGRQTIVVVPQPLKGGKK